VRRSVYCTASFSVCSLRLAKLSFRSSTPTFGSTTKLQHIPRTDLFNRPGSLVPEPMDAGIIAAAQRVEHYEMAGYGTVQTFAKLLGEKEAAELFTLTLNEEGRRQKAEPPRKIDQCKS
jgi:hypothetical protein